MRASLRGSQITPNKDTHEKGNFKAEKYNNNNNKKSFKG